MCSYRVAAAPVPSETRSITTHDAPRRDGAQVYKRIGRDGPSLYSAVNRFYFKSLDRRRSLSGVPPVWQPGQ